MNPGGPVEEASKIVTSTVDALKSTPVILGVLIFNLAFVGFIGFFEHENGQRWERTVELVVKQCVPLGAQQKTE